MKISKKKSCICTVFFLKRYPRLFFVLSSHKLKPFIAFQAFYRFWFLPVIVFFSSCTSPGTWLFEDSGFFSDSPECNIQTYLNSDAVSYISSQHYSDHAARTLIVPFDVPEYFAADGKERTSLGHQLARDFQASLLQTGKFPILEFQDHHWAGKRDEFFSGNFGAMSTARNAGFDFVIVGFIGDIRSDNELIAYTKIIDVNQEVTRWYSETKVTSRTRSMRRLWSKAYVTKDRPDLFSLPAEFKQIVSCTTSAMVQASQAQ